MTDLRKASPSHNILQPCYLHLGLSLQNATLERDVSYKRANKDRTPGKMSTECLSQRLHIQLSGQRPQALKQKTSEAEEFNPLIWGAAWDVTPTCRRPPDKRQLSLEGLLGATGGEQPRKVRKDVKDVKRGAFTSTMVHRPSGQPEEDGGEAIFEAGGEASLEASACGSH